MRDRALRMLGAVLANPVVFLAFTLPAGVFLLAAWAESCERLAEKGGG